jgi:lysophospholipase L1-like esterase
MSEKGPVLTHHPPRIETPTWRKILYAAILVVLALGVLEVALKVRARIRYGTAATAVRDPMMVYDPAAKLLVPRPGYEIKGAKIHIKINSLGFRGDEIAREKPRNTIRIACVGASTTFCAETSSNQTTWPYRLQEKLQAAYPSARFEVINAGVPGYVAADSLKNLRHRVLPLDPDLVIYYEANNQIVRDTRPLAEERGLRGRSTPGGLAAWFSRQSVMFDLAYKNAAILYGGRSSEGKIDRIPQELPEHFLETLDTMRQELDARHARFVLSTFLVKYRRDQDRQTQIRNADVAFYYMPWMSIDGLLNAMDVYNDAILRYGADHHLPVVDDRTAVPADAANYSDCMHLKDAGAEAMAERFYSYFRQTGEVDRLLHKQRAG